VQGRPCLFLGAVEEYAPGILGAARLMDHGIFSPGLGELRSLSAIPKGKSIFHGRPLFSKDLKYETHASRPSPVKADKDMTDNFGLSFSASISAFSGEKSK
jgi:hypothetical protein